MRGIVNEQLTLTACEIGFTSATKKNEFTTAVLGCFGDVYLQSQQYPRNDTALEGAFKELGANETCVLQREQVMSV